MIIEYHDFAVNDIDDAVREVSTRYSRRTAKKLLNAIESTAAFIESFPHATSRLSPCVNGFPNLRARRVTGFLGRVIFYEIDGDVIRILRVLQAGRDLGRAFRNTL